METTAGVRQQSGFICSAADNFSAHTKSSLAHIDKRTARATRNTHYHYNTGSGVSKMETTAGVQQQSGFICSAADNFSVHTKSSLARIDKRTARAAGNTRYRYNKIGPQDHKMADNCVSLARTNTVSSTITKPIKTWKTSNESYSYNLLNHRNKMYTHDLFNLQQEWEAWLAPV